MLRLSSKCIRLIFLLAAILQLGNMNGQVTVNLNVLPPYSCFYRDYAGLTSNKTIITLLNHSMNNTSVQVYLSGSIRKDDNSILIQLKDTWHPGMPITLLPNIPQTLAGAQLHNFFGSGSTNDLILNGITVDQLVMNQAFPEGNYTLCAQVKEFGTGQVMAEDCRTMTVAYYEPPQIIKPFNYGTETANYPQYVMTSWTPVTPFVQGLNYRLRIVKLLPGVTPIDALNNSTQVIMEKSNIPAPNYPLDMGSGVKLDTGGVYVMQVTAYSPVAYFKNNGQSEPVVFYYKGKEKPVIDDQLSTLTFLSPNSKTDTLKVNNESDLLINWNWLKRAKSYKTGLVQLDDSAVIRFKIDRYDLSIIPLDKGKNSKSDAPALLTRKIRKKYDGKIDSYLSMSAETADSTGFTNGGNYKAVLKAYDVNDQLVSSITSDRFSYKRLKDDVPMFYVPVQAVVKYSFKGFPDINPVANTEVTVEAFKQNRHNNTNGFTNGVSPVVVINHKEYVSAGKVTGTTDSLGVFQTKVPVPRKYFTGSDSIVYRLKINNQYYVDKSFGMQSIPVWKKDTTLVNFGQLIALTYAYSLKLNVSKAYTSYNLVTDKNNLNVSLGDKKLDANYAGSQYNEYAGGQKSTMTYFVEKKTSVAGIPIVLYRKNKQTYIPPVEGSILPGSKQSAKKITVVGYGITQVEKDSTYVTFDKLLSSVFSNDDYYIMAFSPPKEMGGAEKKKTGTYQQGGTGSGTYYQNTNYSGYSDSQSGLMSDLQSALKEATLSFSNIKGAVNATQSGSLAFDPGPQTIYTDTGYVAQEMPFKLPMPDNTGSDDVLYRNVKSDYQIVSSKPPTSLVKGKLLYVWKSDGKQQLRPLANADFKIVVDYLADGKSIGSVTKIKGSGAGFSVNTLFFVPGNKDTYSEGMQLLDQYATMAVGKTDDRGNFQVEVVNINQKGSLGPGNMASKGWSYNPNQETTKPGDFKPGDLLGDYLQKVTNPEDQFGFTGSLGDETGNKQQLGVQGLINGGKVSFSGKGFFEVQKGLSGGMMNGMNGMTSENMMQAPFDHATGPCPSMEMAGNDTPDATHVNDFSRVYRISPMDESYYYPGKETFTVDAFDCKENVTSTSFVKEFRLKVITQDKSGSGLDGMRVTVFRDIATKPVNLPIGEGDGKYVYSQLLNPQYKATTGISDVSMAGALKSSDVLTEKFELVCSDLPVNSNGERYFPSLLQAEANNHYYVEACSQVNAGVRTYKATFAEVPSGNFDNGNPDCWTDKTIIPEISLPVKLLPLPSRAFMRVKDKSSDMSISGTPGGARVLVKTKGSSSQGTGYPADKDGYVEFLATEAPLSQYAGKYKTASFWAEAKGYKTFVPNSAQVDSTNATFDLTGSQFSYNFHIEPGAVLTGHIVCPDEKKNGVPKGVAAYIQTGDLGKIMETQEKDTGNLNNLPVANIAGTKIKIIPKDVAYFDTCYVLSDADSKKSNINLSNYNVYRRKHRLSFTVLPKQQAGQYPYIYGGTIQLGDTVLKTDQFGKANIAFENVSVKNYTLIIKGPAGQGFIPKTMNVSSEETKDYVNFNIQLEKGSEVSGKVTLDGNPVKHARVYIDVKTTTTQLSLNTGSYINQSVNYKPDLPLSNTPVVYQNANQHTMLNTGATTNSTPTGSLDEDANLISAFTDANGNYKLQGVPVDNQTIAIIATLDTTFTVNGDNQKAVIKGKSAVTNLALTSFKKVRINSLFGFPLTVEKITQVNDKQVKVNGLVQWTKAISNFNLEEVNEVLRIEDVLFNLVRVGAVTVGVPNDSIVTLQGITDLKLSYQNKYNVKLVSDVPTGYFMFPQQLTVSKEGGFGKIKGKMFIVDNSFNYPSSYLNFTNSNFYFALKDNNVLTNNLSVITSALSENESTGHASDNNLNLFTDAIQTKKNSYKMRTQQVYQLSDSHAKPIGFKLIGFSATADPLKSYIDLSGKIHLSTTLACSIPNAQPQNFSVNIEDMVLDDNKVYPATSTSPINLALENWNLKVKDWSFSVKEGGIVSTNALIQTAAIDIPVNDFVLRNDLFLMDKFNMNSLSMGGGKIPLQNIDASNAHLNYDEKTGKDMKPHWSFGMVSNGNNPVATLPSLPDLGGPTDRLKLNYIQILSNNEIVFQLKQENPLTLRSNSLAMFSPQSIFNGPDYISIAGSINVGAPRVGDIPLILKYTDPSKTMSFDSVDVDFEGKGFVHFTAEKKSITIDNSLIVINGKVQEEPSTTFNPIPSKFIAIARKMKLYKVDMQKDYITQLTSDDSGGSATNGYQLKIDYGGLKVENGDWSTLKFGGLMSCNNSSGGSLPSYTNFEVLGDISANSDNLSVSNISTPFGAMTQTFDFAHKRLIGSIKISTPILLGIAQLNSGTIETCFDNSGFYVAGGCSSFLNAGLLAGTYNLGFMTGSYSLTDHLWSVVNSYIDPSVTDECYRADTKKAGGLKGAYFAVNREVLNINISQDYVLASGYVFAKALLGGDFYLNFGNPWTMGGSGYAYLNVGAGLSAVTGTNISGSLEGKAGMMFDINVEPPPSLKVKSFDVNAYMKLSFDATIEQSLGFTSISKTINVGCYATAGTNGFDFSIGSKDGDLQQCAPKK